MTNDTTENPNAPTWTGYPGWGPTHHPAYSSGEPEDLLDYEIDRIAERDGY